MPRSDQLLKDALGRTEVHRLANTSNLRGLQGLLRGLDDPRIAVTVPDECGYTPLHMAVSALTPEGYPADYLPVIQYLCEEGVAVEAVTADREGRATPLLVAATQYENDAAVELLVARGANPEATLLTGSTALHLAARKGQLRSMVCLYEKRPLLLNRKNVYEETPLILAAHGRHRDVAAQLLRWGAPVDEQGGFINKVRRACIRYRKRHGIGVRHSHCPLTHEQNV